MNYADTAPVEVAEHLAPFVHGAQRGAARRPTARGAPTAGWTLLATAPGRRRPALDPDVDDARRHRRRRQPGADPAATPAVDLRRRLRRRRRRPTPAPTAADGRCRRRSTTAPEPVDATVAEPAAPDVRRRPADDAAAAPTDPSDADDVDGDESTPTSSTADPARPRRPLTGPRWPMAALIGRVARSASMPSHERTATRAATTISCDGQRVLRPPLPAGQRLARPPRSARPASASAGRSQPQVRRRAGAADQPLQVGDHVRLAGRPSRPAPTRARAAR